MGVGHEHDGLFGIIDMYGEGLAFFKDGDAYPVCVRLLRCCGGDGLSDRVEPRTGQVIANRIRHL